MPWNATAMTRRGTAICPEYIELDNLSLVITLAAFGFELNQNHFGCMVSVLMGNCIITIQDIGLGRFKVAVGAFCSLFDEF